MSSTEERIFVIGGTGHIASHVVRGLVKKGVKTTVYARNQKKATELFKEELKTGLLAIVVGDYSTMDIFTEAIKGHTRLFMLLVANFAKPAEMGELRGTFGKIAYEQGVRQIVDLSSVTVRLAGIVGILGYLHASGDKRLWALADQDSAKRSIVTIRSVFLMNNHFASEVQTIKHANKIIGAGAPSAAYCWIDTRDLTDCAVRILTDPVEKHDRMCYEASADRVSHEQRAALFTKILGRTITYEQVTPIELYKTVTGHGLPHSLAYELISYTINDLGQVTTPQLSILLDRPLRTLEQWIEENASGFQ